MAKRIFSATAAVILLLFALYLIDFVGIPLTNYLLAVIMAVGLFEIYQPFGFVKRPYLAVPAAGFGFLIAFGNNVLPVICIGLIVLFIITVCMHKSVKFSELCTLFLSTLYVSFGILFLRLVMELPGRTAMLIYILVAAFITDSGAYFSGCFFGKHKLIVAISPKKTVEGAIGGVITAVLGVIVAYYILPLIYTDITMNLRNMLIIAPVASVVGQFGDLSASMIKRELGIKDFGDIMPGHGGVLDRIDSLIFVAPVVYYLNTYLPILTIK